MRALTREVAWSFDRGLTTARLGLPDVALARRQHDRYVASLREAGLEVTVLPADEGLPDSCFVEDTAVRLDARRLLVTTPGHPARAPEVQAVERYLAHYFEELLTLDPPGTLDGGDILQLDDHFVIGLSERTNPHGAAQLAEHLRAAGKTWSMVEVGEGLHLKSGSAYLGNRTVLCWEAFAASFSDLGFEVLVVPSREAYAANVLRVDKHLWVAAGYPDTAQMLRAAGHPVTTLDMSEFRKQDGALTCLSILF